MNNSGAKDALIARRRWTKTQTVEHADIVRRKRLDAIYRKLRQGVADRQKEKDQ